MRFFNFRLSLFFLLVSFFFQQQDLQAQTIPVYDDFSQLETRLKNGGDTTFVVNFWATWCAPCVAELPFFEELHQNEAKNKVKVLLVSLDFKNQIEKRVTPFLQKKQLKSEVLLLADLDVNAWIPKLNEDWDGAIPVTFAIKQGKKRFHDSDFADYSDLRNFVIQK